MGFHFLGHFVSPTYVVRHHLHNIYARLAFDGGPER